MKKSDLVEEIKLRRLVRKAIKIREHKLKRSQQQVALEENKLRMVVRRLLAEGEVDADTEPVPYKSTAMNLLNDVFDQILPVIKKGLRKLTSGPEEQSRARKMKKNKISKNLLKQAKMKRAPELLLILLLILMLRTTYARW